MWVNILKGDNIMKKRNILSIFIALVVLIASTQMALAYTIKTTGGPSGFGPWQVLSGGEFTLQEGGGLNVLGNYVADTKKQGLTVDTFQSFCLENDEFISPNTLYNATVSQAAVNGGGGGPSPDPISRGTAWLYSNFAQGTLSGYDYSLAGRTTSAADLQNAIWYLEGEGGANNAFVALAIANAVNYSSDNNGFYNVAVLNITDLSGNVKQDMLVATPIPAAVWLLGTGVVGLVGIRRKFKK